MSNDDESAAPAEVMTLVNPEVLGELVKSWATQEPRAFGTVHPVPETIEELRLLLRTLGAGASIPPYVTKLRIVRYEKDELVLRIPPAELIRAKEASLSRPGVAYQVPDFYRDDPIEGTQEDATDAQKMLLQARRIGDYTIAHCQ